MNALGAFLGAEKIRTVGIASADSDDPRLTLRFLLTFDDGPHSHTGQVLRHLARNPVHPRCARFLSSMISSSIAG